jgi:hypothetical protein
MRRVTRDKVLQLRAKIPGFDPNWLWEGDESGLSFDLRSRIAEQIRDHDLETDDGTAEREASEDDACPPSSPLPIRTNGGLRSTHTEHSSNELRDRCRGYERALRKIVAEQPNSNAAEIARAALRLFAG